jgi:hypothetical protein
MSFWDSAFPNLFRRCYDDFILSLFQFDSCFAAFDFLIVVMFVRLFDPACLLRLNCFVVFGYESYRMERESAGMMLLLQRIYRHWLMCCPIQGFEKEGNRS